MFLFCQWIVIWRMPFLSPSSTRWKQIKILKNLWSVFIFFFSLFRKKRLKKYNSCSGGDGDSFPRLDHIGEKNAEFKKTLSFFQTTFVGHRFGSQLSDMIVEFGAKKPVEQPPQRRRRRRIPSLPNESEENSAKKRRIEW